MGRKNFRREVRESIIDTYNALGISRNNDTGLTCSSVYKIGLGADKRQRVARKEEERGKFPAGLAQRELEQGT